jgi:hypothetical protein
MSFNLENNSGDNTSGTSPETVSTGPSSSEPVKNDSKMSWIIAAIITAFLLIFILYFGSFYLSSQTQTNASDIDDTEDDITAISYGSSTTTIDSDTIVSGSLTVGSLNISEDLSELNSKTTALSYDSSGNVTTIASNVTIPSDYTLYLGDMNVAAEINNLNQSAIEADSLTLTELTVSGATNLNSLNGISATTLAYLDATSSIQTQLDGKVDLANPNTFTSDNTFSGNTTFTGNLIANRGFQAFTGLAGFMFTPSGQFTETEVTTQTLTEYTNGTLADSGVILDNEADVADAEDGLATNNVINLTSEIDKTSTRTSLETGSSSGEPYVRSGTGSGTKTITKTGSIAINTITITNNVSVGTSTVPICCSISSFAPAAKDYVWCINAGYKITTFTQEQYTGGEFYTMDNTTGIAPIYKYANPGLSTRSIKVYYLGVEINSGIENLSGPLQSNT